MSRPTYGWIDPSEIQTSDRSTSLHNASETDLQIQPIQPIYLSLERIGKDIESTEGGRSRLVRSDRDTHHLDINKETTNQRGSDQLGSARIGLGSSASGQTNLCPCGSRTPPRRRYCSRACQSTAARKRYAALRAIRRVRTARAQSTSTKSLTKTVLRKLEAELPIGAAAAHAATQRPRTLADCPDSGPCPWVGCSRHLYLDVNPETGTIKLNFPDLEPEELEEPCSERLARRGGLSLEDVAQRTNLTRERIRQIETRALIRLRRPIR